jgi:predicted RNase H-like HicB family nuclease
MKKKIEITIERGKDLFDAYAESVEGVWGSGETVAEAKESLEKTIKLLKEYNSPENIPSILKGDYELIYKFDAQSFLNYYKGIFTNAALERLTGINQKQIQHYATGLKKPKPAQMQKIQNALHQLGNELISVQL